MHSFGHRNPRIVLEEDHHHIDTLLERLAVELRADDRDGAIRAWRRVESVTLAHLDAEEMFLFPALADSEPLEAVKLLDEHAQIRRRMGELGLAFELHTARTAAFEGFCALLRGHAEREAALFYPLAERRIPVSTARTLLERLRGAATALIKPARPRPRRRAAARLTPS